MEAQRATTLDEVRLAILRQHSGIAQLLDELEAHAAAVIAGRGERRLVHTAVTVLQTRLLRHLDFEEEHLPPFLDGGEGLLADHADQRARIAGLVHDDVVFSDASTLAREAVGLVHVLRKDMIDEEAKLRALR